MLKLRADAVTDLSDNKQAVSLTSVDGRAQGGASFTTDGAEGTVRFELGATYEIAFSKVDEPAADETAGGEHADETKAE